MEGDLWLQIVHLRKPPLFLPESFNHFPPTLVKADCQVLANNVLNLYGKEGGRERGREGRRGGGGRERGREGERDGGKKGEGGRERGREEGEGEGGREGGREEGEGEGGRKEVKERESMYNENRRSSLASPQGQRMAYRLYHGDKLTVSLLFSLVKSEGVRVVF